MLPYKEHRLNLFAFKAETDALFSLMLMAAIALAVQLGYFSLHLYFPSLINDLSQNSSLALFTGKVTPSLIGNMLVLILCPLLTLAILFALAFYFYQQHPIIIRKRKQAQPLTTKEAALQQDIAGYATIAGHNPVPTIELGKGIQGSNGQAFGFKRQFFLYLDGGLKIWRRTKPSYFKAIVLHELAHMANGDIWRSYFSEALWKAMWLSCAIPVGLGIIYITLEGVFTHSAAGGSLFDGWYASMQTVGWLYLQVAITLAIILAIRARLLRTREYYADWRAALWGAEVGLIGILQDNAQHKVLAERHGLYRLHPSPQQRLDNLRQPKHLFQLSRLLPFSTGFLLAFLLVGILLAIFPLLLMILEPIRQLRIDIGLNYLKEPSSYLQLSFLLVRILWFAVFFTGILALIIPMGWLVYGVLGVQVEKQMVLDALSTISPLKRQVRLLKAAALFMLGLELGFMFMPFNLFAIDGLAEFILNLILMFILTLLLYLFLLYVSTHSLQAVSKKSWFDHAKVYLVLAICFIPGLILQRVLIDSSDTPWFQVVLFVFMFWLIIATTLSIGLLIYHWLRRYFHTQQPCESCGAAHAKHALFRCHYCGTILQPALFVPADENIAP